MKNGLKSFAESVWCWKKK